MNKITILYIQKIAASKRGKCLSKAYKNNHSKLEFVCEKGHHFLKSYGHLKHQWCPVCSKHKKKTIKDMKDFAKRRKWRCLSTNYINNRLPLEWECEDGHIWSAPYTNVQKGQGCPTCAFGKSERICRAYFEKLFNEKFPKTKPIWLINDKGNKMELDGYCEKLKIAFEYHGQQHYKEVKIFNKKRDLAKQRSDDKLKRNLCKKRGILLVEIPYHVSYDRIGQYIVKKCKKAGINIHLPKDLDYTSFKIYSRNELKRMQDIARSHGGECLAQSYIASDIKLRFKCNKGHIWEAIPDNIIQNHWCPKCNKPEKLNIELFKEIAKSRGGVCLSKTYINNITKLRFRCAKGHEWEAAPAKIKLKRWCPKCARQKWKTKTSSPGSIS